MKSIQAILSAFAISLLLIITAGCNDDEPAPGEKGTLTLEFDTRAGDEDFLLGKNYINASNETFNINKLNYYISNIRLTTMDNKVFTVPQDSSYFMIREEDKNTQRVVLKNIPTGDYNSIAFLIGVDSLRSTMDLSKRPGVLDPAQGHDGMYWAWNSGYIFFKMEGVSPAAPAEQENKFIYHIGGFGGYSSPTINNIREKVIDMGNARAEVRTTKSPEVHLHVDVLEFFKTPVNVSIAENPTVMFSTYSATISTNYVSMFKYDHVHN